MRVAIFVDEGNMFKAEEKMKWRIDYGKVTRYFTRGKEDAGKFFFTGTPYFEEPERIERYRKFRAFLILTKHTVVEKEVRVITDKETGKKTKKCNLDVEIVLHMMIHVHRYDELVLLSGDSDFVSVLRHLRNNGKKIICVARKPVVLDLINASDEFIDLNDIRKEIEKTKQ